jgi:hypothetical protein
VSRPAGVGPAHQPRLSALALLPGINVDEENQTTQIHYAGFAGAINATREPYAYQQEFGIRRLILEKGQGQPVLLWGPYVFSNTMDPPTTTTAFISPRGAGWRWPI